MQLSFSRKALHKARLIFIVFLFLSIFITIYALWIGMGSGRRAAAASLLCPLCALICIWVIARVSWLLRSGAPAASIGASGIEVHTFTTLKRVPWQQLRGVKVGVLKKGNSAVPQLEIQRTGGSPVRLALVHLSNSPIEIERWVKAAQSRALGYT